MSANNNGRGTRGVPTGRGSRGAQAGRGRGSSSGPRGGARPRTYSTNQLNASNRPTNFDAVPVHNSTTNRSRENNGDRYFVNQQAVSRVLPARRVSESMNAGIQASNEAGWSYASVARPASCLSIHSENKFVSQQPRYNGPTHNQASLCLSHQNIHLSSPDGPTRFSVPPPNRFPGNPTGMGNIFHPNSGASTMPPQSLYSTAGVRAPCDGSSPYFPRSPPSQYLPTLSSAAAAAAVPGLSVAPANFNANHLSRPIMAPAHPSDAHLTAPRFAPAYSSAASLPRPSVAPTRVSAAHMPGPGLAPAFSNAAPLPAANSAPNYSNDPILSSSVSSVVPFTPVCTNSMVSPVSTPPVYLNQYADVYNVTPATYAPQYVSAPSIDSYNQGRPPLAYSTSDETIASVTVNSQYFVHPYQPSGVTNQPLNQPSIPLYSQQAGTTLVPFEFEGSPIYKVPNNHPINPFTVPMPQNCPFGYIPRKYWNPCVRFDLNSQLAGMKISAENTAPPAPQTKQDNLGEQEGPSVRENSTSHNSEEIENKTSAEDVDEDAGDEPASSDH
ncbi:nascent polypeptide-associated complex subunit alpha, muscle-specific form-like [Hyalella azteca]|uniref:Nascent polypeptide-associated complex subunit alpha, muscle-specific form-like n=1 Tax=Hyalella azteca TaxID=294128 RepID=A0A979FSY8_HYAAZ|nr:nascent polypeptide-associated complex subunit alpha, muscle-specific form-like [Hyalella azteca]